MSERKLTPEERAVSRRRLRERRERRRRFIALVVVVAGLLAVGGLLAGFVFGDTSSKSPAAGASASQSTSTVCEPTEPPKTVTPTWWTARRQLVLVDSVLLGGVTVLKDALSGWKVKVVGEPAIMLPAMEERMAARERVPRLVVLGIGYNSIWERRRGNYSTWARKFDGEAKELLATLRRKGARQFVWVTLRDARRAVIPSSARWQFDRYAWYFPYVNERLRRLERTREDLVLARWDLVSNKRGLTYDAIHLNPDGAALMARTIEQAIRDASRQQTSVVPPPPGDCG
jgi:lysophospholipase L1-like esterase